MLRNRIIRKRIMSLILCFIMISNFMCSIALAASGGMVAGEELHQISYGTNTIEYTKSYSDNGERVFFEVGQTGLYSIEILNKKGKDVTYELTYESEVAENSYNNNYVGLAVKKQTVNGKEDYMPVTQPSGKKDPLSTKIDVILLAGHKYRIRFLNSDFSSATAGGKAVTITIKAEQGAGQVGSDIKFSDIPSTHITLSKKVDHSVYNPTKRDGFAGGADGKEIPIVTYGVSRSSFIEEYLESMGIKEEATEEEEKGSWIEGAIVDVVLFIGEGVLWIMEKALGLSEGNALTMDKLVFNRLTGETAPIVDLRPLGGIDLGDDYDGILTNETVNDAISAVYRGFKYLAIIIFIIVLLYVAVRIIMSVGTEKESGSIKLIQYWFTGLILLFIVPYFIPVIPYLSNELCKALSDGGEIKKTGDYTVTQIAEELGEKFLGEDADVVLMIQELQKRIDKLNSQLDEDFDPNSENVQNALETLEENWNDLMSKVKLESQLNPIKEQFVNYINSHYEDWYDDDNNEKEFARYVNNMVALYPQLHPSYTDNYNVDSYRSRITGMFNKYKTDRVKMKIEMLESMQDSLVGDPMIMLKYEAKRTNRVVYAIAWIILMFQVFTLVFMYYKRLFIVLLLVVLFPVIVSVYAIDKAGDKQSQSLKVWFQEFLANTTIQFVHSLVYILIVNVGIEICKIDPKRYWIFLVIAVCFLFPAERILRNILGLKSTTLMTLRFNIGTTIGAAYAIKRTAGNFTRMGINGARAGADLYKNRAQIASNIRSFGHNLKNAKGAKGKAGVLASAFKNNSKDWKQIAEATDKKRKRKQHFRDSRQQNRDYRLNAARDSMNNIKNGRGTLRDGVAVVRGAAAKVSQVGSNIATGVRESGIGRAALSSVNVAKYAGKKLANGAKAYKRVAGTAAGLLNGMETMGDSGIGAGIQVGRSSVHSLGGFKDTKLKRSTASQKMPSAVPGGYNPVSLTTPGGTGVSTSGRAISSMASSGVGASGGAPSGGSSSSGSTASRIAGSGAVAGAGGTPRPVATPTTSAIRGALAGSGSHASGGARPPRVSISPMDVAAGDTSALSDASARTPTDVVGSAVAGMGAVAVGSMADSMITGHEVPLTPFSEESDMDRERAERVNGVQDGEEPNPIINSETGETEVAGTREIATDGAESSETLHEYDATVTNEVNSEGEVVGTRIEGTSTLTGEGSAGVNVSAEANDDGGVSISTNAHVSSNPNDNIDDGSGVSSGENTEIENSGGRRTSSSVSETGDSESGETRINTETRY